MDTGILHGVWTLILIVTFVAIVIYAFSRNRRADFERAARIPLEDDAGERAQAPATKAKG